MNAKPNLDADGNLHIPYRLKDLVEGLVLEDFRNPATYENASVALLACRYLGSSDETGRAERLSGGEAELVFERYTEALIELSKLRKHQAIRDDGKARLAEAGVKTTATYTKLRDGSWGARVISTKRITANSQIVVSKKDGVEKNEQVSKVLWHDDMTYLCELMKDPRSTLRSAVAASQHPTGEGAKVSYSRSAPSYMDLPRRVRDERGQWCWIDDEY